MSSLTEVKFQIKPSKKTAKTATKAVKPKTALVNGALQGSVKEVKSDRREDDGGKPKHTAQVDEKVKPKTQELRLAENNASTTERNKALTVNRDKKENAFKQGISNVGSLNRSSEVKPSRSSVLSTQSQARDEVNLKSSTTVMTTSMAASQTSLVTEKKITNLEREKMMNVDLKQQLLAGVLAREQKAQLTAEQEKKMDFESETASLASEKPTPIGSTLDLDKGEKSVQMEAESVIDELQKYLKKKFGPILNNSIITEPESENKTDKTIDLVENKAVTEDKPCSDSSVTTDVPHPVVKPPTPGAVPILPHPIFFKTSIKKDPGSKLHDDLVKELSTVLQKRDGGPGEKKADGDKADSEHVRDEAKIPKRRISAKGNKVLGNKALLANLESQLNRTLHKHKVFQRQRLKVLGMETVEIGGGHEENSGAEHKTEQTKQSAGTDNGTVTDMEVTNTELDTELTHKAQLSPVHVDIKVKSKTDPPTSAMHGRVDSLAAKSDDSNRATSGDSDLRVSPSDIDKLFVYAIEHPEGWTEGIVCSVEQRQSTKDSSGRPRNYLTCINIVADKNVEEEGNEGNLNS